MLKIQTNNLFVVSVAILLNLAAFYMQSVTTTFRTALGQKCER